ncbi:MAG TPA: DNA recombination protein RmuC [candidate division Zixibacteria bacterium]|nr:DNA recombination protein RmuC [candidate division Zixibacteria bacterium]
MSSVDIAVVIGFAGLLFLLLWLVINLRRRLTGGGDDRSEARLESLKADIIQKQMEGFISLKDSLDQTGRQIGERLSEGTSSLDRRMAQFGEIENQLGRLAVQTKNLEQIGGNIQSLSELLKPPQLRGALGEILLENLLSQILPQSLYETQYRLADGKRVDAVIKLADRLLPIDSKFPLEAFRRMSSEGEEADVKELNRVLKKHIEDIASKYIRPDEQTTDIALMYIPSEAVYYRFVSQDDCAGLDQALARNVIPSSPGHLYAFLASLRAVYTQAGLAGSSRELVAGLNRLKESLERLVGFNDRMESSHRRLGAVLTSTKSELSRVRSELERLQAGDSHPESQSQESSANDDDMFSG